VRSNNTRSSSFVIILRDALSVLGPLSKLGTYRADFNTLPALQYVAATLGSTLTFRRAKVAVRSRRPHGGTGGHKPQSQLELGVLERVVIISVGIC
jgi:hypothetical protein